MHPRDRLQHCRHVAEMDIVLSGLGECLESRNPQGERNREINIAAHESWRIPHRMRRNRNRSQDPKAKCGGDAPARTSLPELEKSPFQLLVCHRVEVVWIDVPMRLAAL